MTAGERLVSLADAGGLAARERAAGRRVVLANGCFDLLHVGHVRYLDGARALGDFLIVAVNSDDSVARLKGPGRPLLGERARALLVAGLRAVDRVVVFGEPDAGAVLRAVRPHVHVKGTDYSVETVPERELARALGVEVAIAGDPKRHSTRDLLRHLAGSGPAGR